MKLIIKKVLFVLILLSGGIYGNAQSISVNENESIDYLRRLQLNDAGNNSLSFCVSTANSSGIDSTLSSFYTNKGGILSHSGIFQELKWLPFTLTQQYNSLFPSGWNNGSMIPAAGYQLRMSTGIYARMGPVSLQLQPEIVGAENPAFETFSIGNPPNIWNAYYQWLNRIDMPEQFGSNSYKKLLPGQSSLLYNTGSISLGISTANLWWGPGRQNALVMTNNAPGFLHATLHTNRPIVTSIGNFEGQVVAGKLENSNIVVPDTNFYYNGSIVYQPKINDWRYFTGMVLSWNPKWIKGLFVGFAKSSYEYYKDVNGIADLLPLQGIIESNSQNLNKKASLGSVFMRYVMPEDNVEVYAEYGRDDKAANIVNLITAQNYPRGYIVGFRKLSNKRANGSQIEFAAELTQLELPQKSQIYQLQSWYLNDYVRQGYTNDGRVIGAGIGPGSNSQMMDISWVKGVKKIGIQLERVAHNEDFYYYAFTVPNSPNDVTRHWDDLSATFHTAWSYKRFLFTSEVGLIRSLNYEWFVIPGSPYFQNGYDFLNFHGKLSFTYRL